ncbi:MAG: hypothetical protein RSD42_05235, partial [Oscillospiraceae bacterium]
VVLSSNEKRFGGNGKGTLRNVRTTIIPMHDHKQSICLNLPGNSVIFLRKTEESKKADEKSTAKLKSVAKPVKSNPKIAKKHAPKAT